MTRFLRLLSPVLALLLLLPVAVRAQQGGGADTEALLDALAAATTQAEADGIVPQIWNRWLTAPDATAQKILDTARARSSVRDYDGALQQLDRLIADYPDYAEGWNQRATVLFMTGDYERSLADVAEVLKREPRHFGALSGRAMIYLHQGRIPLAQIAVRAALKVHPFLAERSILAIPAGEKI